MKLLNGKELADRIKLKLQAKVSKMKAEGKTVKLAVIQVGDDPASSVYVRNKQKACEYIGIDYKTYHLSKDITEDDLITLVEDLNDDWRIDGILVQLPLPSHIDESAVINAIAPEKDVDGFHEQNVGKLMIGEDTFVPCTAKGIIRLLVENGIEIEGKNCVVVGRSNIVGKPTAMELLKHDGTVTICHSKTRGLKYICRDADILVCAVGKPKFFDRKYIKPGTVVVDVGIHRDPETGKLCGDADFDDVKDIVEAITPVPGGVGPMTVAMLMENVVEASKKLRSREHSEPGEASKKHYGGL